MSTRILSLHFNVPPYSIFILFGELFAEYVCVLNLGRCLS